MRVAVLRSIPLIGWLYLVAGLVLARSGHAPRDPILRTLWWIDAFLSVVVHAAQIPAALRAATESGRPAWRTAVLTQIFGLTWWRTAPGAREVPR
ncbi:hypothetical protein REK76_17955 [Nocardia farcinica]|uniref:hypothetical protein n=1 Tax=Nocardia farcinica TaxID=37329 RepID=UPI0024551C24|nr:hypothetical protein [Nocardia farcinica]